MLQDALLTYFPQEILDTRTLPGKFTFPFFYEPHPLSVYAATELQKYLENEAGLEHNFGLDVSQEGLAIGKMFGVLIVQDREKKIGYLSAFSGKLAGSNTHKRFVPPVFDMLTEESFFLRKVQVVNSLNRDVEEIETNEDYIQLQKTTREAEDEFTNLVLAKKEANRNRKQERKNYRETMRSLLTQEDYAKIEADLIKESVADKKELLQLSKSLQEKIDGLKLLLEPFSSRIEILKKERKEKSAALQQELFDQYLFLNTAGKQKSLGDIFGETVFGRPPAAAGECATPKLLQYAFQKGYKPLAMAEFWWGASPKSEVRQHKHFYPACTGKCEPILKHMLDGIETDNNPFLENPGAEKKLDIIFEDEHFVVVNKPSGLLSVPGININDSVYSRLKAVLGDIEPLIIHRLDMATSGLLVIAKNKEAHKGIQKQFLKRTIKKRYTALLSKTLSDSEGEINLPLRGDLHDRPRQLVCYEHGKPSLTKWKSVENIGTYTKVHFWPLTGRTHQLRVHAAHVLGLNAPIVGDDLYGTSATRLFLHATYLEFLHPATHEKVTFQAQEDF